MATSSEVVSKLKAQVKSAFDEMRQAAEKREKILMRQIDVIGSQVQTNPRLMEEIEFLPCPEIDILECIRSFGKFNIDNLNLSSDLYLNEDYICPTVDHELMYKCLDAGTDEVDGEVAEKKEVFVNLCSNKPLLKKNIENINESIINITLREVQNLLEKNQFNIPKEQNLHIQEAQQEESTHHEQDTPPKEKQQILQISQSSQTEKMSKNFICKKPSITINNCNGTINLRNISNLTINCANPDVSKTEKLNSSISSSEAPQEQTPQMLSYDEVSEDPCPSNALNSLKDNENNSINCEFYNRLIKEIKSTLKEQTGNIKISDNPDSPSAVKASNEAYSNEISATTSSSTDTAINNELYNRKMLLRNFENLKIVLESNENEAHPVQIEQWLTEIISSTEVEPMQNTDILEHSRISTSESF